MQEDVATTHLQVLGRRGCRLDSHSGRLNSILVAPPHCSCHAPIVKSSRQPWANLVNRIPVPRPHNKWVTLKIEIFNAPTYCGCWPLRAYLGRISQLAISHYFRDWDPCNLCFSPKWISISPWRSTLANNAKSTAGSFGQTYYFERIISWHC